MKKILLLFLTVFAVIYADAQTPPFYNSNAYGGQNSFPLSSTTSNKVQWLTGPNQFATGGTGVGTNAYLGLIDTIWLKAGTTRTAPGPGPYTGLTVSFAQNQGTATSFTGTTYVTGLTTAYAPAGATSLGATTAGQWYPIALTTPFLYNPALSLVVEVKQNGYSLGVTTSQSGATGWRMWGGYTATTGSTGAQMANMGLSLASNLSCATPTAFNASYVGQDSVTLAWTDNNTPAATTWDIEYGPSGFTPTGNPTLTTTTNPHGIGGLVQNTAYDFYVRSYCGPGDSSYYTPLTVTTLASCPWPTNLTATGITATQATLDWTENGTATTWGIEIGLSGFTPTGNATFQTTTKPFTLPGLPQNTCFDYYVQSDCGADSSVFTGPYTFCTLIAPLSCPGTSAPSVIFEENFDNTFTGQTNLPNAAAAGWTGNTISGNPTWALESNTTGSGSTGPDMGAPGPGNNGYMYLEVSCVSGGNDTIKSPSIDLSGVVGSARVKWWNHMYGPNSGKLEVFVDNGTTLTSIYSDSGQTHTGSATASDPWDSVVINLNSFIGQSIQLVYVGTAANPGGCSGDRGVDNISIEACIACAAPANLAASNITSTQADISWTQAGLPLDWHLEVVPSGSTPTGIPTDTAAASPYTITGLTLLTPVDVYVRANCDTNGTSSWTGPITVLPCSPLSGVYTIDPASPASATNFQSVGDAATALQCGVNAPTTFNMAPGNLFNEQVEFPEVMGASAVNTITFNGNGDTISFATNSSNYAVVRLNGSDYFRFNDLTVSSTATSNAIAMHMFNSSNSTNNNEFRNCTFTVPTTATSSLVNPFAFSGSLTSATTACTVPTDSNIIDSCTFIGGYYQLAWYASTNGLSKDNQVTNSTFEDFYAYGFYHLYHNDLLFANNDLSRPTRTSFTTFYGIYGSGNANRCVYEKNYIHDPCMASPTSTASAYGIYFFQDASSAANSNIIENNVIANFDCGGTQYGIYFSTANNLKVYHNTIQLDGTGGSGLTRAIYQAGTSAQNQDIRNNNLSVTRTTSGLQYGIYMQHASATCDYNNVHVASGVNYGYYSGNRLDLAAWQAGSSYGDSSLSVNPIFSQPAPDMTPANSLMDDKGDSLGVADDYVNTARPTTGPDMGAFEFSVQCPAPSALTASNVTSTSFDLSWTENGTATLWDIEIKPTGTAPTGIPDSVGVTNNVNFPISGLTPFQSYDVWVRASCGGTNGNSVFNGPLTVLVCAPLAGNYTIDAGSPASATNFQSFNAAADALGCGISAPVVFDVVAASGPYNEQVSFPEVTGASSVNTITFNGNGETISFATSSATAYHVVQLNNSDWFRFNDLNIISTGTSQAISMHLLNTTNGTQNNMFKNCTFECSITSTSSIVNCFAASGSATSATTACQAAADSNIIDSCTFIGGYYGCAFYGGTSTATYARGNQIINNTIEDYRYYAAYTLYHEDLLFSGNDCSRPTRTSLTTHGGIYASGVGNRNEYSKNRVHNGFGGNLSYNGTFYGFYFFMDASSAANSNMIQNNVVDEMTGNSTHYGIYASTANNLKIQHNTVIEDDTNATSGTVRCIYQAGTTAPGQDIQNNIIIISKTGTGIKHGIYRQNTGGTTDYNNVYITSTTGSNYYGYNGGNRLDLSAWQASTGTPGTNSSEIDPIYSNPAPDYTPSNPLLNGTGAALGILDDYNSNPRSATNPDMGAFEFSVSATDIAFTQILSPDTTIGCYTAADTVVVQLTNTGSTPHNFVTNPTTVTVNVTGPGGPAALTAVVNTGTLATFANLSVSLAPTVNMTANGTYTMTGYATTVGDPVTSNDTISPYVYNVNLTAGMAMANPDLHCISGISTVALTGSMGGAIQWQEASSGAGPWTDITGATSASYTSGTLTSTTYYRAILTCGTNMDTSTVDTVIVNNPQVLSSMNDTICGPNTATLTAMPDASSGATLINWYDVPTGGSKLDTGNVFITPMLSATDTFYAAASAGAGAADTISPGTQSGTYASGIRGYWFVAPTDFTITGLFVGTGANPSTVNQTHGVYKVSGFPTTTTNYTTLFSAVNVTGLNWSNVNIPIMSGDTIVIASWRNSCQYAPAASSTFQIDGITVQPYRAWSNNMNYQTTAAVGGHWNDGGLGSIGKSTFTYTIGCEGSPRTPVYAVVNPSSGDLALATSTNASSNTGVDSLNDMHPDGATLSYYNPTCQLIATIEDTTGNNVLGSVTSTVTVDPTVSVWNNQPYTRRWYDLSVQNNGPATVTLYYTQDDFDDYNAHPSVVNSTWDSLPTGPTSPTAQIRITQISGGGLGVGTVTGVHTPTTVWNATAMRWEMTFPVTGFSQFFLHVDNPSNGALPVHLSDFTVVKNGSVSDASWFTFMETNNSHFDVQRSVDGNTFTTIGQVTSKAANGNSTAKLAYDFTDESPQIGHNYYRLQQVDQDGNMSYSKIIDLVWGADGSVVSIYPNPATDKLNIDVSIDKVAQMEVRLLDMSGRVVKSVMQRTQKGMNNVTLNLSDIATGVYGVQIYENNTLIHSTKVNKNK